MRTSLLWPIIAAITFGVSTLSAQSMGGPPGGGMGGGRPMMSRGRAPQDLPSFDMMKGPYEPDSMAHKFQLDSAQALRYRTAWDSMMAATKPTRDSVEGAMAMVRRARTEGFQQEGARQMELVHDLGKELKKDEEHFDKVIRKFLSKDQWGDFEDWRDRRRESEKEMRQQQMERGGPGGHRPPR
jgi:hypothetical protein